MNETEKKCVKLMPFKLQVNKLADYISKNYPEQVKLGGSAVDIALRVMSAKGKK